MQALERAVKIAGGQTALAEKIGKTQPQIAMWLKRRTVDPAACIPIETAVGGEVTRYDLRPDVFGPPPTAATPSHEEAA
jgi:DNA-binding transcriptional regulator YdaS (Cro superfamily)